MAILIFVAAMAIIAGMIWVMMQMERSHRERIEGHRDVWRAEGIPFLPMLPVSCASERHPSHTVTP